MYDGECVPAIYTTGKKKGQIVLCKRYSQSIARNELIKRDGPPPSADAVCRHMCENDSMAHNGFVCTHHIVWGTTSENMMDKSEENRKKGGRISGKKSGHIGGKITGKLNVECGRIQRNGKISASIERNCPYCGRTIKGPVYFLHEKTCKRNPQNAQETE